MNDTKELRCTAFAGSKRIAAGGLLEVAKKTKKVMDGGEQSTVLIFDDLTSELVEIDFRGSTADVVRRLEKAVAGETAAEADEGEIIRGRGRPKLGVLAREVTLLPRHWQWLNAQPGGASVALRKLVEEARRMNAVKDRVRRGQEVTYRFMSAMAGNLNGFEEATRALFAGKADRFEELTEPWPGDVREHIRGLAAAAF
jgi:uncharacterized protein